MNGTRRTQMDATEPTLSLILFSGTDDKLEAATVLAAGGAAMGKRVTMFLQYWGLEAFRKDAITKDHGVAAEAGPEGARVLARWSEANPVHWSETLRQIKDMGDVSVVACSLSMDMFGLTPDDLDPMVDGVEGVASFWARAGDGQVLFI
jgi:peroxiredoxin family protein